MRPIQDNLYILSIKSYHKLYFILTKGFQLKRKKNVVNALAKRDVNAN